MSTTLKQSSVFIVEYQYTKLLNIHDPNATETRRSQPYHTKYRAKRMSYEPPVIIEIPLPGQLPIGRGASSTGKRGGNLRVRCTNKEYDMIQQEAGGLDLSLAMFCRWCIVHAAQQLRRHRREQSTNMRVGDPDASRATRKKPSKRNRVR